MKHTETYNKSVKFELSRYELRDLNYVSNPNTIGCIVYPIFMAVENSFPWYHLNSAFWSAHSLLCHSNIKERQIPIFFYIDTRISDRASKRFTDAGVDDSMIIEFKPPERSNEIGDARWLSQKLYTVLDTRFNKFETVVFIDTDLFLARTPNSTDIFDVSYLFDVHISDRYFFATYNIRSAKNHLTPFYGRTSGLGYDKECEIFLEKINAHVEIKTDSLYNIDGYINSFCPRYLEEDYKAFIKKMCPLFYNDENINSLYLYKGNQLRDINERIGKHIRVISRKEGLLACLQSDECFFTHIDLHNMTDPDDIKLWKSAIAYNFKEC